MEEGSMHRMEVGGWVISTIGTFRTPAHLELRRDENQRDC